MDPNKLLEEMRELAEAEAETPYKEDRWDQLVELCEKFKDLDNWIVKKGMLPDDWRLLK